MVKPLDSLKVSLGRSFSRSRAQSIRVKLVAFLLALFLWFYVVTENTYRYEMEIPIRVTNLAPDRMLVTPLPEKALVRLEGPGKALIGILVARDVWLVADLAGVTRSRVWRPRTSEVSLGRAAGQVQVLEIVSPETLRVELDLVEEARLPVTPGVKIRPAAGHVLAGLPKAEPESVLVRGPRSTIRAMRSVRTEFREYSEVRRDLSVEVPLEFPSYVSGTPGRVRISARVEKLMDRTFFQLPVSVANTPPGTRGLANPASVDVVVRGGLSLVPRLDRSDVDPFVDYSLPDKESPGEYSVQVRTPAGVEVVRVEPPRVRVLLQRVR
ncbi:MAG: hypothetical protein ONB23_08175 [candidate division KSB1 bacterium]|nr:hypothetical protein [candidate division KSB1 bacterium]